MIALDLVPIGTVVRFTYTNKKGETKIVTGRITDRTDTKAGIRTWVWNGKDEWKGEPLSKQYAAEAAQNVEIVRGVQ